MPARFVVRGQRSDVGEWCARPFCFLGILGSAGRFLGLFDQLPTFEVSFDHEKIRGKKCAFPGSPKVYSLPCFTQLRDFVRLKYRMMSHY